MLKHIVTLLAVFALSLPGVVGAQDLPEAGASQDAPSGGGEAQTDKETVYDFEDDDVTGSLVKPDGENIQAETHGKTSNLIKIRSDFVPEMLESVEEL